MMNGLKFSVQLKMSFEYLAILHIKKLERLLILLCKIAQAMLN